MDEGLQRRIGRNESVFRDVNDAIEQGRWPGEEQRAVAFRCECGRLGCNRLIEISLGEYRRVRAHPRHFLVVVDHDIPEAETIVETHEGYVVVEKRGKAGAVADATDPRS